MSGVVSPFTKLECPICQTVIDISADREALAKHIRQEHKNVALLPIARSLFESLNQSIPENLESIGFDEMASVVANTCKDIANKKGLRELR